jgi:N-acetylglucosaminyldiphosphoundecaprenol N-acetyl-beta-D-mannosaminyltransferase
MQVSIPIQYLLNTPVTCLTFEEQIMLMLRWARMRESKTICLANVHMLMEAYWDRSFAGVLEEADMVTPDGMPLVWMLQKLGIYNQNRVAGLDVFINLCELAQQCQIRVYCVGSEPEILSKMKHRLEEEYPVLQIAGMETLPQITVEEIVKDVDDLLIDRINESGAGIVFVCLGCPKQEIWMSRYQGKINAVMIGVGAVFSMYAGLNPRAPYWLQKAGLEWMYRLLQEPRRLWSRYGKTIPPFLYLAIRQLLIPYQDNLERVRHSLVDGNMVIDIAGLNYSPILLGEILVRQSLLTQEILDKVLLEQTQNPSLKLGEILVKKDLISVTQLRYYLKNQKIKLGEILVEQKVISLAKINTVVRLQKYKKKKVGELLVELNMVSKEHIKIALMEQYWRRKGLWLK